MKVNKVLLVLFVLGALLLGGCSGRGQLTNWPAVTTDAADVIFVSHGAALRAIDASGNEIWHYPEKPDASLLFFAPAVETDDGQLIVGGAAKDTRLFSLNPQTGRTNWEFTEADRGWVAGVLVYDDVIYAPNANGRLYALDLQGSLLWDYDAGSALWAQPVTDGQRLYLTALNHEVHAIDLKTGAEIWHVTLPSTSTQSVVVDADNNLLYVGGLMDEILALDAANGETVWTYATDGWVWQSPVLVDGVLYFGDQAGNFYAINVTDQTSAWGVLQPDGGVVASPLVLDDMVVFVTEAGSVYGVSSEGKVLWNDHVDEAALYTQPVALSDGTIVIAPMNVDELLMAYTQDGRHVWDSVPEK